MTEARDEILDSTDIVEIEEIDLFPLDDEQEVTEEQADELESEELQEDEPELDNRVKYGDRVFEIGEPDAGQTLRILKIIGALLLRGEGHVARALKTLAGGGSQGGIRAVLFGVLVGLNEADVIALGSACLQFSDYREGKKWIKERGLLLAPIVKAFFLNVNQSDDLRETLKAFFEGAETTGTFLQGLIQ